MSDNVLSADEAKKQLSDLRSQGGGGKSMFAEYLDDVEGLEENEVLQLSLEGYSKVSGLRRYLDDNASGDYEVKSAKAEGEEGKDQQEAVYEVFVFPET